MNFDLPAALTTAALTTADRIQRLREFSTGERGPYDGIAEDMIALLADHARMKNLLDETKSELESLKFRVAQVCAALD